MLVTSEKRSRIANECKSTSGNLWLILKRWNLDDSISKINGSGRNSDLKMDLGNGNMLIFWCEAHSLVASGEEIDAILEGRMWEDQLSCAVRASRIHVNRVFCDFRDFSVPASNRKH